MSSLDEQEEGEGRSKELPRKEMAKPQPSKIASSKPRLPKCGKGPSKPLCFNHDGRTSERSSLRCAKAAMSAFNDKFKPKLAPKYEIVKALGCMERYPYEPLYHCNFIGRPKHGTESDDKLFFAELTEKVKREGGILKSIFTCTVCRILGPPDSKPGLRGCRSCARAKGWVHHPRGGFDKDSLHSWDSDDEPELGPKPKMVLRPRVGRIP